MTGEQEPITICHRQSQLPSSIASNPTKIEKACILNFSSWRIAILSIWGILGLSSCWKSNQRKKNQPEVSPQEMQKMWKKNQSLTLNIKEKMFNKITLPSSIAPVQFWCSQVLWSCFYRWTGISQDTLKISRSIHNKQKCTTLRFSAVSASLNLQWEDRTRLPLCECLCVCVCSYTGTDLILLYESWC